MYQSYRTLLTIILHISPSQFRQQFLAVPLILKYGLMLKKRLNRAFNSLTKCIVKHFLHHLEKPENCRRICRDFVDPTIDFALRQTIVKIHQIDAESPFIRNIVQSSEKFVLRRCGTSIYIAGSGFLLVFCLLLGMNYHIYLLTEALHQKQIIITSSM